VKNARVLGATPAAPGALVPFGVDTDAFTVVDPPRDGPILFVGRLERRKGVRELVDAVAQLPEARLVLAGEGPESAWIDGRGLGDRVELLGAVPAAQVPLLLRECALLCAPSHGEPYGMTVLEAMAAGRAVVATDAGGPRFLLGSDGGALVPVGDAAALARELASLLADPDRLVATGRRNRERAERELSLGRMLDRLEDVYLEAAA
jgi:glycosyltransferase involved in cell wall biosynthesis